jgi:repressor LexA
MSVLDHLTDRQQQIYQFIHQKITHRGYGPTVREIGENFGISSPNGVMCHLKALEKKGLIRRSPNKSRAIELTREAINAEKGLPLAGKIAAGLTQLAFEQQERIDFGDFFNRPDMFVLQVAGESMIEAQIADGDYVVVRKQTTAHPGQIVVAQTSEGEATLKYWYPEKHHIRLQPANASMEPLYLKDAQVMGVVVGVVRSVR